MTTSKAAAGYFHSGIPYNRFGRGPRNLVLIQGLLFENKPLSGQMVRVFLGGYNFLEADYTVYSVVRRPGLPRGSSLQDMADSYAGMIREEFGGPVDLIGVSTGGSIVQHFAADHPDLVRRLVLHSSAYTLKAAAKKMQLRLGELARRRQWGAAYAVLFEFMLPRSGVMKVAARPFARLGSLLSGVFGAPDNPSDLIVTIEAEDRHDFKDRLAEITAPTLVVAGDQDPFYTPELFRETADGIPNARLILYEGMGHPAAGKQFSRDVLAFLKQGPG